MKQVEGGGPVRRQGALDTSRGGTRRAPLRRWRGMQATRLRKESDVQMCMEKFFGDEQEVKQGNIDP